MQCLSKLRPQCTRLMDIIRQTASLSTSSTFYDSTIEKRASDPIQKMSLVEMLNVGRAAMKSDAVLLQHARFVQQELPKRLAKRLLDLRFLPHIVIANPHIRRVYDAYNKAFDILHSLKEITTIEQNEEFTRILKQFLDEQSMLLNDLAAGLKECLVKKSITEKVNLQPFVEGILRSRIGRRVIAEHHIGLHEKRDGFIGCICTELNVHEAIESAAAEAQFVCKQIYGTCPELQIESEAQVTMPYIPGHFNLMLLELFKNAMRAQMERSQNSTPIIHAKICQSDTSVTVRISDKGGGIVAELLDKIWDYGFSTTSRATNSETPVNSFWLDARQNVQSDLSGYGFGLPFSRLHARYFGGDLQLVSIPGYGVDVFLTTKKLDRHGWSENGEFMRTERVEYKAETTMRRGNNC